MICVQPRTSQELSGATQLSRLHTPQPQAVAETVTCHEFAAGYHNLAALTALISAQGRQAALQVRQ